MYVVLVVRTQSLICKYLFLWVCARIVKINYILVASLQEMHEGKSISNHPIHFWRTETAMIFMPCFNTCSICGYKIARLLSHSIIRYWMSNMVSDAKACSSSKVEYGAVIRYFYWKGKTGKEIHCQLADIYGSSAPSYAQVKFWVGKFKRSRMSPGLDAHWMPPTKKCVRKFGIWYTLIGEFRQKK